MIKTLLKQVKQYKKESLLTPLFTALEVLMEVLIPFITASIIDKGIEQGNIGQVYFYGGLMLIMAFLSLLSGVLAGKYAAAASSGFACNLRDGMYENIQRFSFSNIDKYSTAGLVTRMTTDVTNVQNSYQMILRIAVRAPLMLVCSMAMCFLINVRLSLIFLAAIVVLAAALGLIMTRTTKIFDEVFRKYDDLNASVQENVSAIRVVKAFVREEHENNKFTRAAENLYRLFVKAEGLLALNNPVMMLVVYGCIISLSWFGAKFIVVGGLTTGELTSMFSYVMSVLMSLMMLSMIFVMVTMSAASGRRIAQVLDEKADLTNPENPLMSIPDGSISFSHVSFSYKHGSGEETLHDIDLQIRPGETIGIIGGTGSGKSSLVNLISRLYDVDKGVVRVGGNDVRRYDMEVLRDQVAVASISYESLAKVKEIDPSMPTMYDMTLAYGSISSIEHVDYFSVDDFFVTQELVDEVQGAGKIIYAWTVNDPANMSRLIDYGIDGLVTDDIAQARELYEAALNEGHEYFDAI